MPVSLLLAVSILLAASLTAGGAAAQKENSCDRTIKDSSRVTLNTPVGVSSGKVCLDDGDSFGIGNAWVRLRGIDAPEIARNCLKHFDALPPRCEPSKGAIQALLALSELLETGADCKTVKKGHLNRWPVDCTLPGDRNLAKEMVIRGFACATNSSPDDFKAADFEARKKKVGLWADEWAEKRAGLPSAQCTRATTRHLSHIRYLERKARKTAAPQ